MPVQLAPVDPNVRLPAAVVAATQRALQMQKEMMEPTPGPDAPEAPPAAGNGGQPQPTQTAAPAPPPTAPAPEAELEHKLRSAEGRLARAERERSALAARLAALEAQRPAQPQPQPVREDPITVSKLVTPEEEEEYGSGFLDVVARKAREEIAAEMFKVQRRLNDIDKSVGSVATATAQTARQKMQGELDAALPQWRDINYDDRFVSWLALPDPFSGSIRHDLLKAAYAGNMTQRVLNFFKAFVAEEAAGSPPASGNGTQPAPNGGTPPAKVTLESLAAPGRASPAAAPVPAEKPIITTKQITQFYADVAAGKYRGREAEKLENDAAIILAANEGRIV